MISLLFMNGCKTVEDIHRNTAIGIGFFVLLASCQGADRTGLSYTLDPDCGGKKDSSRP